MGITIDSNAITNGIETAKNISKVMANVTNNNKPNPPHEKKQENLNQPHNQTVEVKVGETNPANQKPMIIKEKSETHIHKPFPDQRELSARECEVETIRIRNDHEYKMRELELKMKESDFRMEQEELNRKERREREEYERKERERRRERDRKLARNVAIGMGALGAIAVGCAVYDFYTNSRGTKGRRVGLQQPGEVNPISVEGCVK